MNSYNDFVVEDFDSKIMVDQESLPRPEDTLGYLEKLRDKIESDIKKLWDDVMVPYLTDINRKQVMHYIDENDYSKFFNFMTKDNELYKWVNEEIYNFLK